MDSGRLPWFAIWTRISCDAVLLIGGVITTWGMLFTSLRSWFFPYGILAAAVVVITAYSRKRRFLLLAILLNIAAITLLVTSWGKISPGVLLAFGYLATWPTLALLWIFLDRRATRRIDLLISVDQAEEVYQQTWLKILTRAGLSFILLLWMPAASFYCATLIPSLITQVNSRSWPQTQGTVMLSEILEENTSFFQGNYNLVYRYQVDGKIYRGTRHNAIHPHLIENWHIKQLAEELAVGSTIAVHYRETDPTQSLLQTGIDSYFLLLLLSMLFHVLFPLTYCFHLYDTELRFLLSPEKHKLFNTPARMACSIWPAFSAIVALFLGGGCLIATDYAPWGMTLTASYLIFRWANRKATREQAAASLQSLNPGLVTSC